MRVPCGERHPRRHLAVQRDLKRVGTWARKRDVEYEHGAGLDIHHAGRGLPELYGSLAAKELRPGLVHEAVMHDFPNLLEHQVYACGAPIMVESAERDFVARCGLPDDEFYADSFTSEADKHGPLG